MLTLGEFEAAARSIWEKKRMLFEEEQKATAIKSATDSNEQQRVNVKKTKSSSSPSSDSVVRSSTRSSSHISRGIKGNGLRGLGIIKKSSSSATSDCTVNGRRIQFSGLSRRKPSKSKRGTRVGDSDFSGPVSTIVLFGNMASFRRVYSNPLLIAREPGASESEIRKGEEVQRSLNDITSCYILRRTNDLNRKHLPDKLTMTVMIRLSPLQKILYHHLTERARNVQAESAKLREAGIESPFSTFAAISALRKLVNHPALTRTMQQNMSKHGKVGFFLDSLEKLLPPVFTASLSQGGRSRRQLSRSSRAGRGRADENSSIESPEFAGKMMIAARMMSAMLKKWTQKKASADHERIVIVSNFTETLDIFARLLSSLGAKFVRLDGSVAVSKRQRIVDQFNEPSEGVFAFLLSSKAGGCGINLIGGNRLILFDPSWNPADDRQAAARIWRDGQKKKVLHIQILVYRDY